MAEMLACTERHRAMRSFAFIDTLLRTCGFDPERPAKWARLACVPRDADNEGSDLIDCEEDGLERQQPEDVAILACIEPGCERYFRSVAHDLLIVWCPMFELRWIFCTWSVFVKEEEARRCFDAMLSVARRR